MRTLTRREFLSAATVATAAGWVAALGTACRPKNSPDIELIIQGAASPPSLALLHVANGGIPATLAAGVRFEIWNTVDEARASLTSGHAHLCGLPINVAAALYNRGLSVRLLNVYIWSILYLVSADSQVTSLADLRGQPVLIPFRGDLPDILTQYLLQRQGLDLARDCQPMYVATAPEAAQLLVAGRARHAVLSEPAATLALQKAGAAGLTLQRVVDYAQAWAQATGRRPRMPMAGVVAAPSILRSSPDIIPWFQAAHRQACAWVAEHGEEASALGAEVMRAVPPAIMSASLPHILFEFVPAQAARTEVEFFLSEMRTLAPEWIGGDLPPDAFYHGA
ncbi:MAG: ABC transporter substrate-binding protein [Anaerolineae bacterium]